MNTLTDYYKSTGGSLGKTVQERFADPNFAKAAEMAGFNSTNYTINANNADANTKILSNLKVLQASGGLQSSNTGAVQTTGNQATKDAAVVNNINGWLNGQSGTTGATTGNPTGGTANGTTTQPSTVIAPNTPFQQDSLSGIKKYYNQATGAYDITDPTAYTKVERTSTDPMMQKYYDSLDQINATSANTLAFLSNQLQPARQAMAVANQGIIDQINQNFDQAIKVQQNINASLMAGTEKFGYLTGRSRYAPETQKGILVQQMQEGADRITALNVQRNDLITKAKQAQSKEDFDALYKIWSSYQKVQSDTADAVNKLYEQSVTAQKNALDAQTKQLQQTKASITDSLKGLDAAAPSIAQNLATLPPNLQEPYLQKLATQYGVDVNQVKGAVITYQNERSDKKKTGTGSGAGSTVSERNAYKENQAYSYTDSLINEDNFAFQVDGKSDPVQLKDDNGYITPQGFRLLNSRVLRPAGISREDFIKQYPELFYTKGAEFDNYGLTASEKKILMGTQ